MGYAHSKALGYGALGMTATLVVASLSGAAAILYPPVAQDVALDKAVRHVAVVWRAEGREPARTQLEFELAKACQYQSLSASDCSLHGDADGPRSVRCEWDTRVAIPFSDLVVPLAFTSSVNLTETGAIQ